MVPWRLSSRDSGEQSSWSNSAQDAAADLGQQISGNSCALAGRAEGETTDLLDVAGAGKRKFPCPDFRAPNRARASPAKYMIHRRIRQHLC
jgi:hypothetical protein